MARALGGLLAIAVGLLVAALAASANETTTYEYDALGRLKTVSSSGTVNNGQTVATTFDAAGNRVSYSVNGVPVPTLSIVNLVNGAEGGANGSLTVAQSSVSGSATTVSLGYAGSAKGGGVDFNGPASATIPAGTTSATVAIAVVNDNLVEGSETISVSLGAVTAGTANVGTPNSATNTLADNDSATVSIANTINGSEPSTNGVLTLTQTNPASTATTLTLSYSGTGTNGSDYTAPASVTIPANATSATVTLAMIDDTAVEGSESAVVTLASIISGAATLGTPSSATNTLVDNDFAAPSLSIGSASNSEGKSLFFAVTRSGSIVGAASASFATANGTATSTSDYLPSSGTVTFKAGQATATITVISSADNNIESSETMTVTLSSPVGATITTAAGTGTILDNSSTLAIGNASANEGGVLTFTVTRTGGTAGTASAIYATSNLTATAGSDYTAIIGTVSFAAGQTSATITVNTLIDSVTPEAAETLRVTISAPSAGASIPNPSSKGTGAINAN